MESEFGDQALEAVAGVAGGGVLGGGLVGGLGRALCLRDGVAVGRWGLVGEEQFGPRVTEVPVEVVGERADEDVGADALFEAVADRSDLERAFEGAEGALDLGERGAARKLEAWLDLVTRS